MGLVATGRGPRLTFLLLSSLFFRWDLGNPFDVLLGVPHSEVPDSMNIIFMCECMNYSV